MSESSIKCEIYEKCIASYNELINCDEDTDYKICLGSCIEQFNRILQMDEFTNQYITSNTFGKCMLLNNKKSDFYTFTYNIEPIITKIENNKEKLSEDFLENFRKMFDTKIYNDCCNCVNIVLYYNNCYDLDKLLLYLPNILASLKNIEKYLPDWILRLYLDRTLFETLYNYDLKKVAHRRIEREQHCDKLKDCFQILKELSKSKQCEINILFCEEFYKDDFEYGSLRTLRFTSFYDPTVNISASREADGILSAMDCHNLSVLQNNDFIMSLYVLPTACELDIKRFNDPLSESSENVVVNPSHYIMSEKVCVLAINRRKVDGIRVNTNPKYDVSQQILNLRPYSEWLNNYKKIDIIYNNDSFYLEHINLYPILAGLVSLKCKFNKSYFDFVQNKIKCTIRAYTSLNTNEEVMRIFNIGYDEILLQELFRPIYYLQYESMGDKKYVERLYREQHDDNKIQNRKIIIKNAKFLITNLIILISDIDTHTTISIRQYIDSENIVNLVYDDIKTYNELTEENKKKFITANSIHLLDVESGYQKERGLKSTLEEKLIYNNRLIYNYDLYQQLDNIYKETLIHKTKYLKYKTKYLSLKNAKY
jgi:hypothetical protein